jgi:hypothetical protein
MSKNRTGNFIAGGNPQTPSLSSNNGVFDINEVYENVSLNRWQSAGGGAYEIARSLRFRSSASASLSKTFSTAGNRRTWTFSSWIKRCNVSNGVTAHRGVFAAYVDGNDYSDIAFAGTNQDRLRIYQQTAGGDTWYAESNMYFRDPSAWYHIVVQFDNTLAVSTDRIKLYVNGVNQTFASYTAPAQNTDYYINSTTAHQIARMTDSTGNDMYMTETNFIDGQALDPSYFGYFDPITNIWQPKKYTGGYGTNGFYLPFNENQTTLNLGRNFAGSNYFTYSEQFDNAAWTKYQSSVTSNATTAPDGTTTADKLVGSTGTSGDHQVSQSGMVTAINNGVYTFSCYGKASERSILRLYIQKRDGSTYAYSDFNLTTGQIDHSGSGPFAGAIPKITFVGNGWYRCAITLDIGTGAGGVNAIVSYATGTGETAGWGLFIWGAQINLVTTVDPYIQTVA